MADGSNTSEARTTLRHTLLANGFPCLPLDGKACYVEGWSFATIDDAFIERFRRSGSYRNTGIRCGNIVALDIDIDDVELAARVDVAIQTRLGPTQWCRWGRGERRILLYWTDDPIAKLATHRYSGQQVEILGRGNQFAAFGEHPTTGDAYEWEGCSPACCHADELPAIDSGALKGLVAELDALLNRELGPADDSAAGGSVRESQHDYCLTDEMVFDCLERGVLTVAQLREQLPDSGAWECHLTAIRPLSDSGAGRAHRAHDGRVCVSDFVTGLTYFEVDAIDDAAGMEALRDALAAPLPSGGGLFYPPPSTDFQTLLTQYCYVMDDGTVRRLDDPATGIALARFSQGKRLWIATGPGAGNKKLLTNYWLENGAIVCARAEFRPELPDSRVITEPTGERVLNSYVMPQQPMEGGSTALFYDFMVGLIPDRMERTLLLDWLAQKVQTPWVRMHGMVVVSEEGGTGRNTLIEIMGKLLGERYCKSVKLGHVLGSTYQSQYSEWLDGTLLATISEAQDTAREYATDWHARKRAYEAIKDAIETKAGLQYIVRKGVKSGNVMVYTSLFIATNNPDALAIDANDRRVIVLSGGRARTEEFYRQLHGWLSVPANIGALYWELRQRENGGRYNCFGQPPMTPAKARMIDAATSDLDRAWLLFKEEAPGDLFTAEQWKAFIAHCIRERGFNMVEQWQSGANSLLGHRARRLNSTDPKWQVRIPGSTARIRPWSLRNHDAWGVTSGSAEILAEVVKNGDPTQKVGKLTGPPWD